MFHEALDAAQPGAVGVAHAPADFALDIVGEAVLRPSRQVVQVAAHGPQEVLGLDEAPRVVRGQHALGDQVAHVIDPV